MPLPPGVLVYVINLKRATDRWAAISANLDALGLPYERVEAVDGRQLPDNVEAFDDRGYRLRHGKKVNKGEIGCYLSHIEVCRRFLQSNASFALVLEDDAQLDSETVDVLARALEWAPLWDLLRLSGIHGGSPMPLVRLGAGHTLAVNLTRFTGSAAYVVNRKGAAALAGRLLPMRLPFDHAYDREWTAGYSVAAVNPPIIRARMVASTVGYAERRKLNPFVRYLTVFPYRTLNECSRMVFRPLRWAWLRLFVVPRLRRGRAAAG